MCVNMVLGPFVDFCTPAWFTWAAEEKLHALWMHWVLRQYADQGSFEDVVAKIFWISLVDKFQILIVFTLACKFNSLLHARNIFIWWTELARLKPTPCSTTMHKR
jgi:hypothetical protein